MIGFTAYDEVPSTKPTTQEILAALTGSQKTAILNGFALKTPVTQLKHSAGIHSFAIKHLYRKLDEIEEMARKLMNDSSPPATATALRDAIKDAFVDDFNQTQVTAILSKMVQFSRHNGTGDWAFYKTEVVK